MSAKVAVLGAGVMGETLLSGLIRAGRRPEELLITERREERAAELRERYGVDVVSNLDAAKQAETLVLVVKPQDMPDLLAEIAPAVQPSQTAILGAGVMGETLLSGLVRAGRRVDNLLVGEKRPDRARELEERYGVAVIGNREAAEKADTIALVVKPQDMGDVLAEIAPVLRPGQLLVSLAAGITTAFVESHVPDGVAVVRVMPNTPALVDEGMAAISPGSHCDDHHLAEAEELMASVGKVLRIPERQQDAVTAISGSGPAYLFFVVESMIEAGVHLGLPRSTATDLVVQTVVGSGKMLRETGTHPTVLREQVTSPAGTTAAALRELEVHKVRAAFLAAMEAARDRSRELAEGS